MSSIDFTALSGAADDVVFKSLQEWLPHSVKLSVAALEQKSPGSAVRPTISSLPDNVQRQLFDHVRPYVEHVRNLGSRDLAAMTAETRQGLSLHLPELRAKALKDLFDTIAETIHNHVGKLPPEATESQLCDALQALIAGKHGDDISLRYFVHSSLDKSHVTFERGVK